MEIHNLPERSLVRAATRLSGVRVASGKSIGTNYQSSAETHAPSLVVADMLPRGINRVQPFIRKPQELCRSCQPHDAVRIAIGTIDSPQKDLFAVLKPGNTMAWKDTSPYNAPVSFDERARVGVCWE